MTRLVMIRHAPTAWNRAKRLQGHSDIPLDEAGRGIAISWRPGAAAWTGWRLLSSPLRRASETAALLFPGKAIAVEPRLIEMSFGDWEGKTLAQLRGEKGAEVEEREVMGLDFHAPGGESPRQVQQRLQPLLAEIGRDGRDTVCIAHKAVLRALYAWAVDWDMRAKPPQKLQFGCAHLFDLDAVGRPALRQLNIPLSNRNIPT
ncbi:histidine phosphatase family protein [Dongia soli]|uniref:Histidine phosphatase family protein n=1 Tax=Dongia soli TaxID=600628 RepID=A0ABU5E8E9_9PROT|nr:histidine phosphatase family protein [Dongia soli]MDY0882024.1 histidine phosphatase family protein [Dongia soli]